MAITIREPPNLAGFNKGGTWGTLLEPRPFEIPIRLDHGGGVIVGGVTELETTLGFEAEPSTDVWCFNLPHAAWLQVDRLCDDIYGIHVGVALVDGQNRRVAPLVQSVSGIGDEVEIQPGFYKLIAALGVPERIVNLRLRFTLSIVGQPMFGLSFNRSWGYADAFAEFLAGIAFGGSVGWADPTGTQGLKGFALGLSGGYLHIRLAYLVGLSDNYIVGGAHVLNSMRGVALGASVAGLASRQQWIYGLALCYGSGWGKMFEPPPPPRQLKGLSFNTGYGTGMMLLMTFGELRGESLNTSSGTLQTYAYGRLRGLSFTYIGAKFEKGKLGSGRVPIEFTGEKLPGEFNGARSAMHNPNGGSYLQVLLGDTGYMTVPFQPVVAGNRLLTAFESGRLPHPGALPLKAEPQGGQPQGGQLVLTAGVPLRGLATGSGGGSTGASSSRPVSLRGMATGGSLS